MIPATLLALSLPVVVPSAASAYSLQDFIKAISGTTTSTVNTATSTVTSGTSGSSSTTSGCAAGDVRKAFAKWGDTADYSLAPGGDLETATGWKLTGGAKIVSGNENLGVQGGSKSLQLPLGATATSPAFCVDESTPYFRFVSKPAGAIAGYTAAVLYSNASGKATKAQFTASSSQSWSPGTWSPSAVSPLGIKIPLLSGGNTASVQIVFTSTGNTTAFGVGLWGKFAGNALGNVNIDSLMVDPYRRG